MARTPPAPASAPVLDDTVELPADGEAMRGRFRLRLQNIASRVPALLARLPLPKIRLSKKLLILIVGGAVGVGGIGAAA
jgi:hypothetical protein